jgi:hypothetical protein
VPTKKPSAANLRRLATAVRAERLAQEATLRQVAERGGLSVLTVIAAEKGEKVPRAFTLDALDRGLGWPPGMAKAVLNGAEPPAPGSGQPAAPPSEGVPAASDLAAVLERLARLEGKVDAVIAMLAAGRGTP